MELSLRYSHGVSSPPVFSLPKQLKTRSCFSAFETLLLRTPREAIDMAKLFIILKAPGLPVCFSIFSFVCSGFFLSPQDMHFLLIIKNPPNLCICAEPMELLIWFFYLLYIPGLDVFPHHHLSYFEHKHILYHPRVDQIFDRIFLTCHLWSIG